jgi:hypothetical protein
LLGEFWQPYIGQSVGGEFDMIVLIGGAGYKMNEMEK